MNFSIKKPAIQFLLTLILFTTGCKVNENNTNFPERMSAFHGAIESDLAGSYSAKIVKINPDTAGFFDLSQLKGEKIVVNAKLGKVEEINGQYYLPAVINPDTLKNISNLYKVRFLIKCSNVQKQKRESFNFDSAIVALNVADVYSVIDEFTIDRLDGSSIFSKYDEIIYLSSTLIELEEAPSLYYFKYLENYH